MVNLVAATGRWMKPPVSDKLAAGQGTNHMNLYLLRGLLVSLLVVAAVYAQKKPEISVSPARVRAGDHVLLSGFGFAHNAVVTTNMCMPGASQDCSPRYVDEDRVDSLSIR